MELLAPLTAGSFKVRIDRDSNIWYGNYDMVADWTPANTAATETEVNDTLAAANTNPQNRFAGAIGHYRAKGSKDLSDYYQFTLTQDTNVHFDITLADTLLPANTTLSLRSPGDVQISATTLFTTSETWERYLAAGTFYLKLNTVYLAGNYGGYTIATTTTPAVTNSSETEINDTLAQADLIPSWMIYGSIGYCRDNNAVGGTYYDNYDYFSCQVTQGGTLNVKILSDSATLVDPNNTISIRNAGNTVLASAGLSTSPQTVTASNLDAGTYYILVYRKEVHGQGAYQINVSGNVLIPNAAFVEKNGSCGGKLPCYTSIQAAIDGSGTGTTIFIATDTYEGTITLNAAKSLTFQGGWDPSFENQKGTTGMYAPVVTGGGMLTLTPNINVVPKP